MILTVLLGAVDGATCNRSDLGDLSGLIDVVWQFLSLSLFSIGGGNTLLTEYYYMAVDKYCWLTDAQFSDLYAFAEAAPGPSSMLVGLLGMGAAQKEGPFWQIASAYAAEISILLPSTLLMVAACLSWNQLKNSPWHVAFEKGLGPITLGILFAIGLKILDTANTNLQGVIVSIVVCCLMLKTKISPLWFMAAAGLMGGLGLINR
ncbi:MAG: chromate transporter [Prochlorococcus sp.]|nr:chromate transporter [Prochlorococcaceae cyanobacterium Fu_MAG_50]